MRNKSKKISLLIVSALSVTALTVLLINTKDSLKTFGEGITRAAKTYTLTLDASSLSGANGNGSAVVRSANGGKVQFDYSGLSVSNGKMVFANDSTLLNPRLESDNNNYISGISKVLFTFAEGDSGSFTLDYTWGDSLLAETPYYQRRGYVLTSTTNANTYSFLGERPNFLKFTAKTVSTVESLTITYSCSRDKVEPGDNLVLNTPSQFEQFKTIVNRGNSFEGQTVELGSDIDLRSYGEAGKYWDIGNTQNVAFKGTFEGNNHTISNYTYINTEKVTQVALFGNTSGATIKNLKLDNFNVSLAGKRAAGLIARADKGTIIENVELMSGQISGAGENGGLVAVAAAQTTITNCVNRASVNSLGNGGGSNGGILGYAYAGAITLTNCINYGSVYGSGEITGGILGLGREATTLVLDLNGCENFGLVSGTANVGGIGGLPRKSSANSKIRNCNNYGQIVGSSYVGGIVGRARITIENCGCYSPAILTVNGTNSIAGSTNQYSGAGATPGYVSATLETGGKITNCYLIEETIGSFNTYEVANKGPEFTNGRLIKLKSGKYFFTAVSGYAYGNNIEEHAFDDFKIRTNSYGWDYIPNENTQILSSNFCPLELPDGRLVIFYRTNPTRTSSNSSIYYSSIRAIVTNNNGETWTRHCLFENYSNQSSGAYEPFGVIDGNTIQVYFACDIQSTRAGGLGPDNSQFVETFDSSGMLYQNILRTTIDFSNGGFTVGSATFAIEATANYRRPGMPSIVKLIDGSYAMVLEHCGSISTFSDYGMVVAISYSNDLVNWTTPKTIITPSLKGDKNYNNLYRCGAPFVQLLPSGKIAVSYMTNEYYYGYEYVDAKGNDSWFRTQEIAVSTNVVSYNSAPTMTRLTNVRTYGENIASCYGACSVMDNKLIMISNNYEISLDGIRIKQSGILFSVANLY